MRFVVTGANRGIGLELARQLLALGHAVEAGVRDVERAGELRALGGELRVHPLDVGDDASAAAFGRAAGQAPVDVLINNAGVLGAWVGLSQLDMQELLSVYNVNALGALRVTRALLPALRRGQGKKVVHVTSSMASLTEATEGGAYSYRMSKAALNMACRSLAADLRPEGIINVVLCPGWVQTDMGGPGAPTPVAESVRGILQVIDRLTLEDTGSWWRYDGGRPPW